MSLAQETSGCSIAGKKDEKDYAAVRFWGIEGMRTEFHRRNS